MNNRKRIRARDVKVGDTLFAAPDPFSESWRVDEIETTRRGKLLFHRHIGVIYCGRPLTAKAKCPILCGAIRPEQWAEILV